MAVVIVTQLPTILAGISCQLDMGLRTAGRFTLPACLLAVLASSAPAGDQTPVAADPALRIGEIELDLSDVFAAGEIANAAGLNRTLRRAVNTLHVNSRPWLVQQELLFATGDPVDAGKLAESERNLRGLGIFRDVRIAPVDTTRDGQVRIRVSAHDAWTLSTALSFALASGGGLRWSLTASERNFLGRGLLVRVGGGRGLDAGYGRVYFGWNRVARSPLTCELNVDIRSDGHDRWVAVAAPFRADDQLWSWASRAGSRSLGTRWYLSNAGPAGADPARNRSLHAVLPYTDSYVRLEGHRRISASGGGRIWRAGLGLAVFWLDFDLGDGIFELSDGRFADLSFLGEPGEPLARDRGTEVWPQLIVSSQGRRWIQTRYLVRYGDEEDVALDPSWQLRAGPAGPAVGSTRGTADRWRLEFSGANWDRLGRSFWFQQVTGQAVLGEAADRNHVLGALLGSYVRFGEPERPWLLKTFGEVVHGDGLRGDAAPVLGLDRGLRTLDVDGMAGDRLVRWNTELGRTLPWVALGMVRTGWGVYYGGGLARWQDEARDLAGLRHEIGCGLRLGPTRAGTSDLARVDLTYDLTGEDGLVITTVARGFF